MANALHPETRTERSLELRLAFSAIRVLLIEMLVLFVAAGSLAYWQGWTFLGLQLASTTVTNLYLVFVDRELLRRRLLVEEQGESDPVQKRFFRRLILLGVALLLLAGLDWRFSWSTVPLPWTFAAILLFALGSLLVLLVFRENTFASSVIEVMPGQRVVATGPYRWVRHPMYTGVLLMNLAIPLILGSYWAELIVPLLVPLFAMRLRAEEEHLSRELPGYGAYVQQTPYRLLPGVW